MRPSKVPSVRSQRDLWNVCQGAPVHSTSMPANFTTLVHFSVSSAIGLPKSVGEPVSTGEPNSANRASSLGSANPTLISLLSLSSDDTHRPCWISLRVRCAMQPGGRRHRRPDVEIADVQISWSAHFSTCKFHHALSQLAIRNPACPPGAQGSSMLSRLPLCSRRIFLRARASRPKCVDRSRTPTTAY
jgi:hypothetical protein